MSESGQNVKKKNIDVCLVCSKPPYQSKKISSKLLDFSIKDLLLKYGGISKDKGVICRNCERRLETLHKKTVEFYGECQSAARKHDLTPVVCNKRLPTSPLVGFNPKRASLEINEDYQQPSQHASSENMFEDLSSNAEPSNIGIPDHSYAGETITPILTQPENNVSTCIGSDHDYVYMNRNTLYNPVLPDITTFLKTTTSSRSNNHLNQEEKSILINVIQNDKNIYGALMKIDNFRNGVISELCLEIDSSISTMGNRKLLFLMLKAAFVYAILMQSRNIELSLVQRMVSMLLMDNICDQKVYDRLQPLGACLCYGRTLTVVDLIGGSFNHHLIDNLKLKRFRMEGDNVNWKTSVHDEKNR
ncbi:unnamed protein product [Mytilus coruscus]|uniref:ZAD domain-containing protein n=1 Tax=Mytilus coruscus TaxID=42192 RepID=A0A6J8DTZ5_MYTCO|nr:unnamed protein product [Mytilus coruscus]